MALSGLSWGTRAHAKKRFEQLRAALAAWRATSTYPYDHAATHRYGKLVILYTEARRRWRAVRGWA